MKAILQQNANITSNSKQLALLKKHFPNCFDASGSFCAAKLQQIVEAVGGGYLAKVTVLIGLVNLTLGYSPTKT